MGMGKRSKGGFTLVELIAVVIILGILAAVGIPQYRKAMERARGAEAYSGLGNIQEAEKIYYSQYEGYYNSSDPMTNDEEKVLDIALPQTGWSFTVVGSSSTFTGTAKRKTGPCKDDTVTVTQAGGIDASNWQSCVDGL